jgi:hypothetical protein
MGSSPKDFGGLMANNHSWQVIPTNLTPEQFEKFVLPNLTQGSRGPKPKLSLHKIFNYILQVLHTGCQWKYLVIEIDENGNNEIHYTRIYKTFRSWVADGCMEKIMQGSVIHLYLNNMIEASVIHGDGTTTAAKKGGDNIGFNGHKKN